MRRGLGVVAVIAFTSLLAMSAIAGVYESYKDTFATGGYSGNHGSLLWGSSWYESGESDGPSQGHVHVDPDGYCVSGDCLHIFGQAAEELSTVGAKRYAVTSIFAEADLCFDLKRVFDEAYSGEADAYLYVEVSTDGGSGWNTLAKYSMQTSDSSPLHVSFDLGDYLATGFALRFVVSGPMAGEAFIDNVEVKGLLIGETTTTTTTSTTSTTKATTTTTTRPTPTTTTTTRASTTTSVPGGGSATTSAVPDTTTTTTVDRDEDDELAVPASLLPPSGPPEGSGLRQTATGVQSNFEGSMYGEVKTMPESLSGYEVGVNYLMAVEIIEASWAWMALLGAVLAWSIVSVLDRRRKGLLPS